VFSNESIPPKTPADSPSALLKDNYLLLQQFVYRSSGIVLGEDKGYLFEARLAPILRKANLASLNDLCSLIRMGQERDLQRQIVDAMTTNETLFFRDVAPFTALRTVILPEVIEQRKAARHLRFWSAASSSGQEAYSLAMLLQEMGLEDWRIEILGTDLSESMIQRARLGRYMQIEVDRGLPASLLAKYFTRAGTEWEIKNEIRKSVKFERFDLRDSMSSLGPFDFVFCRNVLIYFDVPTRKSILSQMESRMNHGGYLVLGAAETTLDISNSFDRRLVDAVAFYRKP
jgi:chemotaxis protein methyltransferase CheR